MSTVATIAKQKCAGCGRDNVELKICGACHTVGYCSSECQKEGWPDHKGECKRVKKELAEREIRRKEGMSKLMSRLPKRYVRNDLRDAVFEGKDEELEKILAQGGFDVNWAKPETGGTSLWVATGRGYDKCVALLIKAGADLAIPAKNGYAPVHAACSFGRTGCLAQLLDAGADKEIRTIDNYQDTALHFAAQNGYTDCLRVLLDRGANPNLANKSNCTPASCAAKYGKVECLQWLIKAGAELNERDKSGDGPLDYARAYEHGDCVQLLIANGAKGR